MNWNETVLYQQKYKSKLNMHKNNSNELDICDMWFFFNHWFWFYRKQFDQIAYVSRWHFELRYCKKQRFNDNFLKFLLKIVF